MRLGDRPDDRESESGASFPSRPRGVDSVEALEDPLALVRRNPWSVVEDGERHPPPADLSNLEANEPVAVSRVVDGVPGEVAHRLGNAIGVSFEDPVRDRPELEATVGRQGEAVPEVGHEGLEIDRLDAKEVALLRRGEQEQVIDQARHAGDLRLDDALDTANLLGGGMLGGGKDLELASHDGERRAQLV